MRRKNKCKWKKEKLKYNSLRSIIVFVQGSWWRLAIVSSLFNALKLFCVMLHLFQSVLRGDFEMALFGLILRELLSVWIEVAEVLVLGQEGREDVEFSAREVDLHDPLLLVWLRMLQMVFEDSEWIYIGVCRLTGGMTLFRVGGYFPKYFHLWSRGTCAACLFSCNQPFVLV